MSDLHVPFSGEVLARELIESLPVPAGLHRGGALIATNAAMQRLCGMQAAEFQDRDVTELVAEADRDDLRRASEECLTKRGEPPAQFTELVTREGNRRQVEITQRRISLDGSDAVLLTCVDHSDIHHVQSSLFALSDMLRQIVDGGPVATFVVDMNHRVTHWNAACERLTGLSSMEMIGHDDAWRAFYPEKSQTLADMLVNGASPDEITARFSGDARESKLVPGLYEVEAYFPRLGETGRWLYFTAAPLRSQDGKIIGAIETLQDITQRRAAEEELMCHRSMLESLVEARSEELAATARELEAFIDNAPIGVAYISNDRVDRANRALENMFGRTHEDTIGSLTTTFMLQEGDRETIINTVRPRLAQGEAVHIEHWLKHSNGQPMWVQMNAFMPNPKDPSFGAWWMLQDRTDVRRAEEELHARLKELSETNRRLEEAQNQLLQSEKMASIGQLAAGVAHEINNPIGFVSSNLNTLRQYVEDLLRLADVDSAALAALPREPLLDPARQVRKDIEIEYLKEDLPQLLDESADGLSRVKKIVQDLKDFSRVDQAEWQETDLNAGLESTLNVVRNEVKYKAEVVKQLGQLPPVTCLAGQLNQVFMNLIVNASHAIREQGTITLSSGHEGDWAWVQVDDTGCGMTEEVRRRIFEPFYTTKEVGKGTGLGLSLSFSIMQRHNGAIQVRSVVGQGSSFRVWVPVGGPSALPTGTQPPQWA